jgi:uncharacterized protein with GYD domain
MTTYVALVNFTEQGVQNFRDTRQRADNFRAMADQAGVTVRDVFWLLGRYDGLLLLDAPDEETVTALMLALASLGNVRTQTLRAYDSSEIGTILGRVPGGTGAARGSSGGTKSSGKSGRK